MEGCADLHTLNLCRIIAMGDGHGCFLPAGLIACHLYMHNWLYLIIKIILYIQSFAPMNSFFFFQVSWTINRHTSHFAAKLKNMMDLLNGMRSTTVSALYKLPLVHNYHGCMLHTKRSAIVGGGGGGGGGGGYIQNGKKWSH